MQQRWGASSFVLLCALTAAATAQAQVTFTAILTKEGTEKNKSVTENKSFRDNFPNLRIGSRNDCTQASAQVCLPAECDIDFGRTYSTNETRPFYVARGFGRGGPGYGVVMNSVISADGGWASHHLNAGTKCLSSTVRVCGRRFVTGGAYEAYHEIYAKCATLQPWKKSKNVGPFTLNPGFYTYLDSIDTVPGSGTGIPGTAKITKYSVTISNKTPATAPLLTGMFLNDPNVSGANGPHFWAKNSKTDLSVTDLEVTQGIQNLGNAMSLISGRRTMVRGYILSDLDNLGGVRAELRGYYDGVELPGSPLLPETEIPGQTTGGDRLKINDSFLFALPPSWTAAQKVLQLDLTVDPQNLVSEDDENNNRLDTLVWFEPPTDIDVTSVPLHLHPGGASSKAALTYTDSHPTFWPILNNLLRYHPVSALKYWDCNVETQKPAGHDWFGREWNLTTGLDQALLLSRVSLVRALTSCGPSGMHWVGLVHPDISTSTGSGSTLGIAVPFGRSSWVKMQSNTGPSWSMKGGETLAHELAHNLGLFHADCSGDEGFPLSPFYPYPYPDCRMAKGANGYYGLDVYGSLWGLTEPAVIGNDPNAPLGNRAFPFMGYKNPGWTDPFAYCRLLLSNGIFCNPLLIAGTFPDSRKEGVFASLSALPFATASPSAPRRASAGLAIPNPPRPVNEYLLVSGALEVSSENLSDLDVHWITEPSENVRRNKVGEPTEAEAGEDDGPVLELLQLGNQGAIDVRVFQPHALDGLPGIRAFFEAVPAAQGVTGIQISLDGKVLAQKLASSHKPDVRVVSPKGGGTLLPGTLVSWQASDPDGDPLTFSVFYSHDSGQTWRLLAMDLTGNSYRLPERLPGSSAAQLRVMAHDGFWTTSDVTDDTFTAPRSAPRAIILQASGAAFAAGRTVTLTGIGTDPEQGPITDPGSFTWSSDRDGALGSGPEISTRTLSVGVHWITLAVKDGDGKVGRAATLIYVGVDPNRSTWSRWLNIDRPSGVGDFEMLTNFVQQGVCAKPLAIECRTTSGNNWVTTGQVYTCDPVRGGFCVNSQQPSGSYCQDYEVRFLCPGLS